MKHEMIRLAEAFRSDAPPLSGTDWEMDATIAQLSAGHTYLRLTRQRLIDPATHLVCVGLQSVTGSTFDADVLILIGDMVRDIAGHLEFVDGWLRRTSANAYILLTVDTIMGPRGPQPELLSIYSGFDGDRALAWIPSPSEPRLTAHAAPDCWCRLGGVADRAPNWTIGEA